jgi:hypothetical protein
VRNLGAVDLALEEEWPEYRSLYASAVRDLPNPREYGRLKAGGKLLLGATLAEDVLQFGAPAPRHRRVHLPDAQAEHLAVEAQKLGVTPEDLLGAAGIDLIEGRDEAFPSTARHVIEKKAELYQRLS